MTADKSIYESSHPMRYEQGFGIALGRITKVYTEERMCEVKTFQGQGSFDDQHIPKCQWLCLDTNPAGDEQSIIPRENSTGLVVWVGGEPFIIGYFKALQKTSKGGGAITGKEPTTLNAGDKVISTAAGNRIVVKSSGLIEVHSSETLHRIYFPTDRRIIDRCSNYVMQTDGGKITWENINAANQTLFTQEYRADLARTNIVIDEVGAVSPTTIKRTRVGPGVPGLRGIALPTFEQTLDISGAYNTKVLPAVPAIEVDMQPTGDYAVKINTQSSLTISPTGDFTLKNPVGEFTMATNGDLTFKNPLVTFTATSTGETSLESSTAKATFKQGQVALGGPGGELLDLLDQTLALIDAMLDSINQLTVPTAVGPSGPPINMAAFIGHKVTLSLIKTTLGIIKGSL